MSNKDLNNLGEAIAGTLEERERTYGPASVQFARWACMARPIIEAMGVTSHSLALVMMVGKISRICTTPGHYDSHLDLVGYAQVAWDVARVERNPGVSGSYLGPQPYHDVVRHAEE